MWLNCFLLRGIRKIWLGLRCDNDNVRNVIKSAIIMSIAWRLHCSKSLTFLAELYTCTKRSIWYVRLLLQSWKKFEMTEFLNFYATKHIIKFFTSCDIWKLGRQTVKLSSAVICCLEAQTAKYRVVMEVVTSSPLSLWSRCRVIVWSNLFEEKRKKNQLNN